MRPSHVANVNPVIRGIRPAPKFVSGKSLFFSLDDNMDLRTTTDIEHLRLRLNEKPQNAKIMAELSCLLAENPSCIDEALVLADKSIRISPEKPYGYTARSLMVFLPYHDRQSALDEAIRYAADLPQQRTALVGLLVRKLVEPRDEERRRAKSGKHLIRNRPLDAKEKALYTRTSETLELVKSQPHNASELVAKFEFRLGLFFRKIATKVAAKHFRATLGYSQYKEMASFWLGTLELSSGSDTKSERCPRNYVIDLYQSFAPRFDALLLDQLDYQTPQLLRKLLLDTYENGKPAFRNGLDLGCGTGLSGLEFRDLVSETFVGRDLSPAMLERASQREERCYDRLMEGDAEDSLLNPGEEPAYDLVLACDVLCYLGDLQPVMQNIHNALHISGLLCCSIETKPNVKTYALETTGRFVHGKEYISQVASPLELITSREAVLRKNKGESVWGMLAIFKKVAA